VCVECSFYTHLPAYEDGTECSETSAYKIQAPGNYPEESIQPFIFWQFSGNLQKKKNLKLPSVKIPKQKIQEFQIFR
jgi:hypothetical protein